MIRALLAVVLLFILGFERLVQILYSWSRPKLITLPDILELAMLMNRAVLRAVEAIRKVVLLVAIVALGCCGFGGNLTLVRLS